LDDETRRYIDAVRAMWEVARESDLEAVRVAREDVKERMEGFPAEYAKKAELDQIRETVRRLDREAINRDTYESRHEQLKNDLGGALKKDVFEATLREWTVWREGIDRGLNVAIGKASGIAANWKMLAAVITLAVAVLGVFIVGANYLTSK
jgi:hypothetical protein